MDWGDFTHAMRILGFATTHLGGSGHRFTPPSDWGSMESIVNHSPHLNHIYSFTQACAIGKRLNHHYGILLAYL